MTTILPARPDNDRVRGLMGELVELDREYCLAAGFTTTPTSPWLAELDQQRRETWEHLVEAVTLP